MLTLRFLMSVLYFTVVSCKVLRDAIVLLLDVRGEAAQCLLVYIKYYNVKHIDFCLLFKLFITK